MASAPDARIDDLEDQLADLRAQTEQAARELRDQVDALVRDLRALGVNVPDYEVNPGRKPMSAQARKALRHRLAAGARAAKQVGKGKGRLSPEAKRKAQADFRQKRGKR